MGLHLSQIAEADELLTSDPLALLIGMVLDQRGSERTNVAPTTSADYDGHGSPAFS
ncbi:MULTISPECIES: hypothetical protein [unclassified Frankia]|uniref:hypothetical protein n=1 Tax=unclassified Frankia TaxID=2632575 RepID=UPI002AD4DBB7|nr:MULTISPECIES: hypothetical protein [unclassified Frankia]